MIALMLCIGALPFLNNARLYASEGASEAELQKQENKWLDDYHAHVGLTYGVKASLNAIYLWRGLNCGGLNIQADANVGYGGLYFDMWWNIGTTDWAFTHFQPEVDLSLGFRRWGLDVRMIYIHCFNSGFFDFTNYPDHGNHLELDVRYTVSSKLPISFLWATRVAAADGYLNEQGEVVRAWSSYAELSYKHHFVYDISLYGAIGITPWRSLYTGYQRGFAVQNIELRLRKDWSLSAHCGMMLQGTFAINPSALAADRSSAEWHPANPYGQSINTNITLGFYLK